jgi:CDP-paratose 2-epimerase
MRILVTGGAGFIGSHVAEAHARRGHQVVVLDNLSRASLLKASPRNAEFTWNVLAKTPNVECVRGDVRDAALVRDLARAADAVVHTAGQTAVTTSISDPASDFETNVVGTFCVLEAVRAAARPIPVVYTSTNKVYGENVNALGVKEVGGRYVFTGGHDAGVPETLSVDHSKHTPYGASKLAADLYVQEYGRLYGLPTAVFRMSCICGPRQFGVEDQGWVAHFVVSALTGRPLTIFGDGKQVRDVLAVGDLVEAMDAFIARAPAAGGGLVCNIGGGPRFTLSLLELLDFLERETGRRPPVRFTDWRASDQRVYVSDVRRAAEVLGWQPRTAPDAAVRAMIAWVREHLDLFTEAGP